MLRLPFLDVKKKSDAGMEIAIINIMTKMSEGK